MNREMRGREERQERGDMNREMRGRLEWNEIWKEREWNGRNGVRWTGREREREGRQGGREGREEEGWGRRREGGGRRREGGGGGREECVWGSPFLCSVRRRMYQ